MARYDENGMINAAGIAYGELIRRQRRFKKMNQAELGALVHVGKNAVGAWEAGRSRPDVGSVPVICQALDLTLEEFFGLQDQHDTDSYSGECIRPDERRALLRSYSALNAYHRRIALSQMAMLKEMQEETSAPGKVVRLYRNELAVSAGTGEALDAARGEAVYLYANRLTTAADEMIRVNGDSMEPTFHDGDQVLVQHATGLRPGEIGVFICGDTGYIKEYQLDGLHSHNPAYKTMTFSDSESVRCVGKVLGAVRETDWADEDSIRAWRSAERKGVYHAEASPEEL